MKKFNVHVFALSLFLSASLYAQSEVVVNTVTDSTQRAAVIAGMDNQGSYAVVWQSSSKTDPVDIFFQRFDSGNNKSGSQALVNDSTFGQQVYPAAAMNASGNMVIVWASQSRSYESAFDIKGKLYKNFSSASGEFLINSQTNNTQTNPAVAINHQGGFIVVWESWFQDGSDRGIFAQMFDAEGKKAGSEFQVNTTTLYSQARPAVHYFSDGRFIIAWESWQQNNLSYDVLAQVFASDGTKLGQEFMANTTTADYQWMPDIAVNKDDSFVITWCSWEQDGDDGGIYMQRFSPSYEKAGGEIRVNSSTRYYQWLAKAKFFPNGTLGVIWSSWQQDDSREGVYFRSFDASGEPLSLEERINDNTAGYQWEPDFITMGEDEILAVYSNYGLLKKDYEVTLKKMRPAYTAGFLNDNTLQHKGGKTTSDIVVHVTDASKLKGTGYEVSFDSTASKNLEVKVKNTSTGQMVSQGLLLNKGVNVFYATDEFDGIKVQIKPVFTLELNREGSYFKNSSGSNLSFRIDKPATGKLLTAPIDVAIIWNKPDTSNGTYLFPADTAFNTSMKKEVILPFKAWNTTDNKKVECLILEPAASKNKRWDATESIVLLTPVPYKSASNNTHAQVFPQSPQNPLQLPTQGDTVYVLTSRPITSADKFSFSARSEDMILEVENEPAVVNNYELHQNYPNPFNPSTVISYNLPFDSFVTLKVFDILGREVTTLVSQAQGTGMHSYRFNSTALSSGIYFYRISAKADNAVEFVMTKKMVIIK